MIKKIIIDKETKNTIPKDFGIDLGKLTIITGENNSGKTNFVKLVNEKKKVLFKDENDDEIDIDNVQIVYIQAENVRPGDDELKYSSLSANLIENLSKLFSNLGTNFKLENHDDIVDSIKDLKDKTNENIKSFSGESSHEHKIDFELKEEELDGKEIIKSLIKNISASEDDESRKFEELGQGTQRIIIASVLKGYLDILIERDVVSDKKILILFEEPEIYLHSKYKRALNSTLEKLAEVTNHQVLITTHDSYFIFMNYRNDNSLIHSFIKKSGETSISGNNEIKGIEDELIHILLFNNLLEKLKNNGISTKGMKEDSALNKELIKNKAKTKIYKWDPGDKEHKLALPLYIRHIIHHPDNKHTINGNNDYSPEELEESIEIINNLLQ